MNPKYHEFLKALNEVVHPFPELAVKRAMYAQSAGLKGAGLSRIPLSIIEKVSASKSEAKKYYEAIDDSVDVEAVFLQRSDSEMEALHGQDIALTYLYADSKPDLDADTIANRDIGINVTPEIPEILIQKDIPRQFERVLRDIDDSFRDDFIKGMDRNDATRKRINTKLKKLIIQIGKLR